MGNNGAGCHSCPDRGPSGSQCKLSGLVPIEPAISCRLAHLSERGGTDFGDVPDCSRLCGDYSQCSGTEKKSDQLDCVSQAHSNLYFCCHSRPFHRRAWSDSVFQGFPSGFPFIVRNGSHRPYGFEPLPYELAYCLPYLPLHSGAGSGGSCLCAGRGHDGCYFGLCQAGS